MTFLRCGVTALAVSSFVDNTFGAVVSSKLQVHIPKQLIREGGYDHREALFGVPPYGGSIQQNVYYADQELCEGEVDTSIGFPHRDKDKESGKMKPWPSPFILMVDRGGCSFVKKVRNAQRAGAAGVIIADTTCLCAAGDKCQGEAGYCEAQEPIMADDGSGSDVTIPSFLMFKQDVDPIREVLTSNKPVRLEMGWAIPSPDARVEYELWSTPTDLISREFQRQFKEAAVALGSHAYFTPHMYVYDGVKSGCQGFDGESLCYNLCTNNGRYCSTDPDNDLDKGISGQDVVMESLRRECIWKIYGEGNGVGVEWWDYVTEFMYRCDNEKFFSNEDCVKDAMTHAGVDSHKVVSCMQDSGGLEGDVENTILETQLAAKEASGVIILPAASVNNAALRGELEFATVFKAICAGFMKGSAPAICTKCATCGIDEYQCVVDNKCPSAQSSVSVPVFISALGGVVLFFGCVGLIQWQRSQRQMREQVKGIVAEYMPLDRQHAETAGIPLDENDADFT